MAQEDISSRPRSHVSVNANAEMPATIGRGSGNGTLKEMNARLNAYLKKRPQCGGKSQWSDYNTNRANRRRKKRPGQRLGHGRCS